MLPASSIRARRRPMSPARPSISQRHRELAGCPRPDAAKVRARPIYEGVGQKASGRNIPVDLVPACGSPLARRLPWGGSFSRCYPLSALIFQKMFVIMQTF